MFEKKHVENGVIFNNVLYLAGWAVICDTVEDEIKTIFEGVGEELKKHGTGFENVLRVTVYLRDLHDRERYLNKYWEKYFPKNPPARTCLEAGLGECRAEMDFYVAVPD